MVIKAKSYFATASIIHDFNHFKFPTLFKRNSYMMFFSVFFNTTNKSLFIVKWAPGLFESLLRWPSLVPQHFHPPCVALRSSLHPPPAHGICEKPEASEHLVFGSFITTDRLRGFPTAQNGSSDLHQLFQSSNLWWRISTNCLGCLETLTAEVQHQWYLLCGIHGQKQNSDFRSYSANIRRKNKSNWSLQVSRCSHLEEL